MTEPEKSPVDSLLDVVVYAPIGAFFRGPQAMRDLAAEGRSQVGNARVVGKLALDRGLAEAERLGEAAQQVVNDALVAAARAAGAPLAGSRPPDDDATTEPHGQPASPTLRVVPADDDGGLAAAELPIPDYDNLSASQVVPRLADLAIDELDAVRDYEQSHRGRMTILSRIAQLQAS